MTSLIAEALRPLGLDCDVERRETLAVLVPRGCLPSLADRSLRERIVALAREHGFTHVAVELP